MIKAPPAIWAWLVSLAAAAVASVLVGKIVIDRTMSMSLEVWFGLVPGMFGGAALRAILPVTAACLLVYWTPGVTRTQQRRVIAAALFGCIWTGASLLLHRPAAMVGFTVVDAGPFPVQGGVDEAARRDEFIRHLAELRRAPPPPWPAFGLAYLPAVDGFMAVFLAMLLATPRRLGLA